MKRIYLLLLCFPVLCGMNLHAQQNPKNLTDGEKAYILSKFCTEVKYNYVFYNDLTFDWDSLCMNTLPSLLATQSKDEYVRELQRLCTRLADGHTYIYEDNSDNSLDWIRPFPFKTKRIDNHVFVTTVLSTDFQRQGVQTGCEIIKIDGMDVLAYVNRYKRPYISSSTPQWLDYSPYAGFELTKDKGSKVSKITFKNQKGRTFTIESHRNVKWDIAANSIFDYKTLEGKIGLLKINSFMGNNFQKEFDALYQKIKETDALIIDIRDNMGGNSSNADYIIRHLSETPIKMGNWSSRMYIAAHGSWGYPQEWFMETPDALKPMNKEDVYTKPIMLLVNAVTFSSAENFCVSFRGIKRGKIIGMPTGGSTGNPININLGCGIYAKICTKKEWDVDGNKFIGIGIKPDIEVKENIDIFLKEKDCIIEEALRQIQNNKK
ncbi:S41 family peptidase [Porphyromonas macacae]|uniref:Probable CtpA-like serine protease n=1 Tax=Porphyromonas macacae TaxID=28115 RepID=A0A379DIM6_9PORP|nr:S41 family peptidase [Porphyromonas macacae]SUB78219.1 Probable CtpA-like serine protease [Porphyromonas macacae]